METGDNLEKRMEEIKQMPADTKADLEKKETSYLELSKEYNFAKIKAKIYFAIADMYARGSLKFPGKIISYGEKATQFPLPVTDLCQLYMLIGDAEILQYHSVEKYDFNTAREKALGYYLNSFELIAGSLEQTQIQPVPPVGKFDYDGPVNDAENIALNDQQKKEIAERERVVFQNKLIAYSDLLISKCFDLYPSKSELINVLLQLADKANGNSNATKFLIRKIKE
jgi:hypothetical protein